MAKQATADNAEVNNNVYTPWKESRKKYNVTFCISLK